MENKAEHKNRWSSLIGNEQVLWIKVIAVTTQKSKQKGEILGVRLNEKLSIRNEKKRNQ